MVEPNLGTDRVEQDDFQVQRKAVTSDYSVQLLMEKLKATIKEHNYINDDSLKLRVMDGTRNVATLS